MPRKGTAMTRRRLSNRGAALIAAIVVTLLVTMAGSGLAAPGDTALVSLGSSGEQGDMDSMWSSISADGRYVAFGSSSDNLVEGDTNGVIDIFVRDLQQGTTERVSVDSSEDQQNDLPQSDGETSCGLDISANGRSVAFSSSASNLVPDDTNGACDVFVRDLQAGTTERVSLDDSGRQTNNDNWSPSISGDGRYVAFHSGPDDLVGAGIGERYDVYVRDLQEGTTERASVDSSGKPISGHSEVASMSADGRRVAFYSDGIDIIPNDNNRANSTDIVVRNLRAGTTTIASVATSGRQANSLSRDPFISADGRYVVFSSQADNLVAGDTNGDTDVFVRDLRAKTTKLVSVASSGKQANSYSSYPSISANGRYVAFDSTASNLVPDSDGGMPSVYWRDLLEGTTRKVSVDTLGSQANAEAFNPSMSNDGRYVTFTSYADNLVPNDGNGSNADVFLHELRVQDISEPDTTPPTVTLVTPADGTVYARALEVGADYSCEDEAGGSGLNSCTGTVAKGLPIETGSLGTKTFTVRATDNAGNTNAVTSTYTVAECNVTGTSGDDVLRGTAGPDRICGLEGDDTLKGLGGDDELAGGAGDDSLEGGRDIDTVLFKASPVGVTASLVTKQATGDGLDLMTGVENITGSNHNDTFIGSGSSNDLSGGSGVDQLFGLEGADRLLGGTQNDALRGGAGDDRVVANGGSDDLYGEEGADSLDSRDGVEGNDAIDGGTDADVCSTDRAEESITNCEQHLNTTPAQYTTASIATSRLVLQPNAAGWNKGAQSCTVFGRRIVWDAAPFGSVMNIIQDIRTGRRF